MRFLFFSFPCPGHGAFSCNLSLLVNCCCSVVFIPLFPARVSMSPPAKMRAFSWLYLALGDLYLLSLLLLAVPADLAAGDTLEVMDDAELDKLIRQEQYVIVLFGKERSLPDSISISCRLLSI